MGDLANDRRRLMQKASGNSGSFRKAPPSNPKPKANKKRGCGCKRNKKS